MEGNVYNNIEDFINISTVWKLLETYFKLQASRFLIASIKKLLFLTLIDCKDGADYITCFQEGVKKLKSLLRGF